MKLHRIQGIVLQKLYSFRHSYDKISDAFYWPLLDLLLWGLTSNYIIQTSPSSGRIVVIIISGIVFWIIFWRAQYEISIGLLDELWNKNLVNIFVTPLKFSEWVAAWLIMGIVKGFMSFTFAAILAFVLYKMSIFMYGFAMLPFMLVLLLSGWWIGFIIAGIIMRSGSKVQTLAWSMPWIFAPFSAIYYPVSILPHWAQYVSTLLPMSYVFEGMRKVIATGEIDWSKVAIALGLNIIYLTLSLLFVRKSFEKVLQKGVSKLY